MANSCILETLKMQNQYLPQLQWCTLLCGGILNSRLSIYFSLTFDVQFIWCHFCIINYLLAVNRCVIMWQSKHINNHTTMEKDLSWYLKVVDYAIHITQVWCISIFLIKIILKYKLYLFSSIWLSNCLIAWLSFLFCHISDWWK